MQSSDQLLHVLARSTDTHTSYIDTAGGGGDGHGHGHGLGDVGREGWGGGGGYALLAGFM